MTEDEMVGWTSDKATRYYQWHFPSLVIQWLRIYQPMQGTQVQSLVWEDPTCCGATKAENHNYSARGPRACALQEEKPQQ